MGVVQEEREPKTADPQLEPIEGTQRKSPKRKEKKKIVCGIREAKERKHFW